MKKAVISGLRREGKWAWVNSGRCLGIAAGLSASATGLRAVQPDDFLLFSRGPASLRPQLSVSESYNDNIFYRKTHTVGDFISVLSPGVNFVLGRETIDPSEPQGNYLALDYQYDHFFYAKNDQLNTDQHLVDFANHLDWSRVHLEGRDSVHFLSGIISGAERSSIGDRNIGSDIYYDDYTLTFDVTEKTTTYLRGHYDAIDYQTGTPLYDINNLIGTLGFGFQVSPRLAVFGEGYYGQTAVSPNSPVLPDAPYSDFFGGFIGARGRFTERLLGNLKVGYESRDFSDGTPGPSSPAVEISVSEKFSDYTKVTLSYSRRTTVSVQFAKESYTLDLINAQLDQVIGRTGKFLAAVGASYYLNDFARTSFLARRSDSDYRAFASLTYRIQLWLRAILSYDFEKFSSDAPGIIDYDVNRVSLRLAVGY